MKKSTASDAQSASALMAAAYFPLYLAALAMHYVEYHVLMVPRCFRATLDPTSRVDRAYEAVRARPVIFYAIVIAVAGLVTVSAAAVPSEATTTPGTASEWMKCLFAQYSRAFTWNAASNKRPGKKTS